MLLTIFCSVFTCGYPKNRSYFCA